MHVVGQIAAVAGAAGMVLRRTSDHLGGCAVAPCVGWGANGAELSAVFHALTHGRALAWDDSAALRQLTVGGSVLTVEGESGH